MRYTHAVKNAVSPSEHSEHTDRITGCRIHQLTSGPAISHPTYFLQRSFTPGNQFLIFTSFRDRGVAQLFAELLQHAGRAAPAASRRVASR